MYAEDFSVPLLFLPPLVAQLLQNHAKVPAWEPKRVLKCPLGSQNVC